MKFHVTDRIAVLIFMSGFPKVQNHSFLVCVCV